MRKDSNAGYHFKCQRTIAGNIKWRNHDGVCKKKKVVLHGALDLSSKTEETPKLLKIHVRKQHYSLPHVGTPHRLFASCLEDKSLVKKGKLVPLHAMTAHGVTSPPMLNFGTRWRSVVKFTPRPVPNEQEAGGP
jgi:hypothetical protein